jgi:4-hydroxy-tetrahydrodipicolinate synthase
MVNILPATVAKLQDVRNIIATKEASGDLAQMTEIRRLCGDRITILCGNDGDTYAAMRDKTPEGMMAPNAKGAISVGANLFPASYVALCEAMRKKEYRKGRKLHYLLAPFNKALFPKEYSNPIAIKEAMALMFPDRIGRMLRLPLTNMTKEDRYAFSKMLFSFRQHLA